MFEPDAGLPDDAGCFMPSHGSDGFRAAAQGSERIVRGQCSE